jgi:hypothetical protein
MNGRSLSLRFSPVGPIVTVSRALLADSADLLYQLPAGDQQQGREGEPTNHSRLEDDVH